MKKILNVVVLIFSLGMVGPSLASWHGTSIGSVAVPFQGDPNVIVSAINTSPTPVTFTATTSTSSAGSGRTLTAVSSTAGLLAGMVCTGTDLPAFPVTLMAADAATSTVFLSHAVVASHSAQTISCGANPIYGSRFTCEGQGDTSHNAKAGGCLIQVSADGIALTGTNASGVAVKPYQDAEFCWDFGDPSGQEIFTRPTDGASINANTGQCGPQAAYMYRATTLTNHTITLTIRSRSGGTALSPTYTTAIATQAVVVQAFDNSGGSFYVDFNNGTNSSTCTFASPCKLLRNINTKLNTSHITVLLAEGSKWDCSTTPSGSPLDTDCFGAATNTGVIGRRIGSYQGASGAGAKPQINLTAAACALCGLNGATFNPGSGNVKDDTTFSNLKLSTPAGSVAATGAFVSLALSGTIHADWNCFDNLDFENLAGPIPTNFFPGSTGGGVFNLNLAATLNVGTVQGWGVWGGSTTNSLAYDLFSGTITQSDGIITPSVYDTILTVNSESSGRNDDGSACASACLKLGSGIVSSSVLAGTASTFSGAVTSGVAQVIITGSSGGRIGTGTAFSSPGGQGFVITNQVSGTAGGDGTYNLNVVPFSSFTASGGSTPVFVYSQIDATHFVVSAHANVAAETMYGAPSYWHEFFGGANEWTSIVGWQMQGNGQYSSNVLIHFIYPEMTNHWLYKWVNFGSTGVSQASLGSSFQIGSPYNYCINGVVFGASNAATPNIANLGFVGNILVSESKCGTDGFSGTPPLYFMDLSDQNNLPTANGYQLRNIVFEKNAFAGLIGTQPLSPTWDNWGFVVRDNRVWTGTGANLVWPTRNLAGNLAMEIYRNKIYKSSSASTSAPWYQTSDGVTASAVTSGDATFSVGGTVCQFPYNTRVFFSGANLNAAWTAGSTTTNLYYIVTQDNAGQCSVSTTSGGSVVNAAATSTGTFTVTPVWSVPYEITDNVIQDDRVTPTFFGNFVLNSNNGTALTPSGSNTSLIDRNTYSFPNSTTANTGFGGVNFSTWTNGTNLFDQNSSSATTGVPSGWTCSALAKWSCFNFLLKRDLDPAANDNTPMFLNKAA